MRLFVCVVILWCVFMLCVFACDVCAFFFVMSV